MQEHTNENIKVSVICLAYNQEKYIRHTLEGFVRQKTNFRYEVLIHDDASSDGTADIIRSYAERFPDIIKPIFQKENQYSKGVKISRKYLYPIAKGKYIAFCEGDDYWTDEHKLQKQFDVMEQNPNCSICIHKVRCINEDGTPIARTIPTPKHGIHEGLQDKKTIAECIWCKGYSFQTSSYFIRLDCISEYENYDYVNYFNGDVALLRTALNFGDFWYIDEEMSCWRLLSVGSWNSRFRGAPCELRRNHWIKSIKGDILYDEISERKFHKYIIGGILKRILTIAQKDMEESHSPFRKTYYELLDEFGISRSRAFLNLNLKNKIKCLVLIFIPKLVLWTRPIRIKFRQRFN